MLNQAQIIGRIGKDPEVRYMPSGDAVTNFSVATSERWKDKATGEQKEATEWHRITTFGKLAEICGEYLRKGSLVYIQGKIVTRKWQDKDGSDRYSTEIKADQMRMLSGRQDNESSHSPAEQAQRPQPAAAKPAETGQGSLADMTDDIPFD